MMSRGRACQIILRGGKFLNHTKPQACPFQLLCLERHANWRLTGDQRCSAWLRPSTAGGACIRWTLGLGVGSWNNNKNNYVSN